MIEISEDGIVQTSLYWDCECGDEEDYIHPISEKVCKKCEQDNENGPDAHVNEVLLSKHKQDFIDSDDFLDYFAVVISRQKDFMPFRNSIDDLVDFCKLRTVRKTTK